MRDEKRLYEDGLEAYPLSSIVKGNLLMAAWIVLGTVASSFISAVVGWAYLIVAVILVYVVLRKLVCTNCYYYDKLCGLGWGKLAAFMFPQGQLEDFETSIGIRLAPFVYGLLSAVPAILVIISLILQWTPMKLVVLLALVAIGFYSGGISRKKGCACCKMRLLCPGCVVK